MVYYALPEDPRNWYRRIRRLSWGRRYDLPGSWRPVIDRSFVALRFGQFHICLPLPARTHA